MDFGSVFWVSLVGSLVVASLLYWATATVWKKSLPEDGTAHVYNGDALRAAASWAASIAGLVVPLVTGLLAYLHLKAGVPLEDLQMLAACLVVLAIGLTVGLVITVSLATQTDPDGKVGISREDLAHLPAALVFQMALEIAGIVLILWSAARLPPPTKGGAAPLSGARALQVVKPPLRVGDKTADVRISWGAPDKDVPKTGGGGSLFYGSTPTSHFAIEYDSGDVVTRVTEQKGPIP